MKPLKLIIGVLAIIWILAHLVEPLLRGVPTGPLAGSWWMGKVVAVCIGLIVAVVCFKPSPRQS